MKNYREITLMPSLYKIYVSIVVDRVERKVKEGGLVPQNQMGFKKGMRTLDNIYVLNYLINKQLNKKKGKLVVLFGDLGAAFDSVDREVLGKAMRQKGISKGLVGRCEEMVRETRSRVKIRGELSDVFCTRSEVRQGCPLNPGLFNLVTVDLKEELRKRL